MGTDKHVSRSSHTNQVQELPHINLVERLRPEAEIPCILLWLAQKGWQIECQKLLNLLRGIGRQFGRHHQIAPGDLRSGLERIGISAIDASQHASEIFAMLDGEDVGTIEFSTFIDELRRVRKLSWQDYGSHVDKVHTAQGIRLVSRSHTRADLSATPDGTRQRRVQTGRQLLSPYQRPETAGAAGSPVHTISDVPTSACGHESVAESAWKQGELRLAVQSLEAALELHAQDVGSQSSAYVDCSHRIAEACNKVAMQMLAGNELRGCLLHLKRAQSRALGDAALLFSTFTNLACYHRRRGNLKYALQSLERAVEIDPSSAANGDTHLNICAIHSEMGQHHEAMHHARIALRLIRDELGLSRSPRAARPDTTDLRTRGGAAVGLGKTRSTGMLTGSTCTADAPARPASGAVGRGSSSSSASAPTVAVERMAALAIAHHNLAVAQEALFLHDAAQKSHHEVATIVANLGPQHPLASFLRKSQGPERRRLPRTPWQN